MYLTFVLSRCRSLISFSFVFKKIISDARMASKTEIVFYCLIGVICVFATVTTYMEAIEFESVYDCWMVNWDFFTPLRLRDIFLL